MNYVPVQMKGRNEKLPYDPPSFQVYGDATELTLGGGGNTPESSGYYEVGC